jgi:peptidoglycan-associated lipoprotein
MMALVWSLLAVITLLGCEAKVAQMAGTSPLWTVENPNASVGNSGSQREGKMQTSATSSLEALQSGASTVTPPSSPVKDVYFAFDRYDLTEEGRMTLKANAAWLKNNPAAHLQVEGHCDERGTADYNLALGAKRAQTAKDYMVTLGISAERLTTISYGAEIPVCADHTEDCWAQNRRARFVIGSGQPIS